MAADPAEEYPNKLRAFTKAITKTNLDIASLQGLFLEINKNNCELEHRLSAATSEQERNEAESDHRAATEAVLFRIGGERAHELRDLYRSLHGS